MKKFFMLLFGAFTLSMAVHAQDTTTIHHHQHSSNSTVQQHHSNDMMQELNLTAEQKTKMQELRAEEKTQIDSIHKSSASEDEKRTQIRTLRENQRKAMEDLLTPEQKKKWEQMRSEHMEQRKAEKQKADSTH